MVLNITTSLGCVLVDVVFTMFLQHHYMVEQCRILKTTVIQRRYNVVFLLGADFFLSSCEFDKR